MGDGIDGLGTESYLWRENAWMRKEIERLREENKKLQGLVEWADLIRLHRIEEAARKALFSWEDGDWDALRAALEEEA